MTRLEKSIVINVPSERVFAYLDDPTNLPEVWPSILEVSDVERQPDGAPRFRYVYKMAGVRFIGTTVTTEFMPNQRHVLRSTDGRPDGLSATISWTFTPERGGTRVGVEVDYTVPGTLLGKLAGPLVARLNDHEAELVLANLKARLEG